MYNDSASTVLGIHIRIHLDDLYLTLSTNDLANRVVLMLVLTNFIIKMTYCCETIMDIRCYSNTTKYDTDIHIAYIDIRILDIL